MYLHTTLQAPDVFGNFPIPYPKREFLSEDDEEKQDKSRDRNNGNKPGNNGRSGADMTDGNNQVAEQIPLQPLMAVHTTQPRWPD